MGGIKNYLNDLEVARVEKILDSYPPEVQEQIYTGTWKNPSNLKNGDHSIPFRADHQVKRVEGFKPPNSAQRLKGEAAQGADQSDSMQRL